MAAVRRANSPRFPSTRRPQPVQVQVVDPNATIRQQQRIGVHHTAGARVPFTITGPHGLALSPKSSPTHNGFSAPFP